MEHLYIQLVVHATDPLIAIVPFFLSVLAEKLALEDPVFRQDDRYFLTTEEAFDSAMKKSAHYVEVTRKLGIKSAPELHFFKRYMNPATPGSTCTYI